MEAAKRTPTPKEKGSIPEDVNLYEMAVALMQNKKLIPDFDEASMKQMDEIKKPESLPIQNQRDLRGLLWFSIDNDDSRDLDQITYAENLPDGYKIFVGIADVSWLVQKNTPIDQHAANNTATVYTPTQNFWMLPEKLCTDYTSLNPNEDRFAMVVEMKISELGEILDFDVYQAVVRNKAKLTYNRVGDWLEEKTGVPEEVSSMPGLKENLQLHDIISMKLRKRREGLGALNFQTTTFKIIVDENKKPIEVKETPKQNKAQFIIENFMIAANTSTVRFLMKKGFATIRRVVKTPERWNRIVELAEEFDYTLPGKPDAKALQGFLNDMRERAPEQFSDLSLSVIKLMGRGEYIVQKANQKEGEGHFALAIHDYTHSTAPNRRFPDLVNQRMLKAAIEGSKPPYTEDELEEIAHRCSENEKAIDKLERSLNKSAIATVYFKHVGKSFESIVVGSAEKGTWVRLLHPEPPIEGKLVRGFQGLEVGNQCTVVLIKADPVHGFIDFERMGAKRKLRKSETPKK